MHRGQLAAVELGEDHTSELEALLAAPLEGLDRASESAGEEDFRMGSGAAWETNNEGNLPAGMACPSTLFKKKYLDVYILCDVGCPWRNVFYASQGEVETCILPTEWSAQNLREVFRDRQEHVFCRQCCLVHSAACCRNTSILC